MCNNKSTDNVTFVVEFCLIGAEFFLVIRHSHAQEVVSTLKYVPEPTYSFYERQEEKGQLLLSLVDKTGDSTCHLRDSKDHYLYYFKQ